MESFLDKNSAAIFLSIHPETLKRLCRQGLIPFYRPEGLRKLLFDPEELRLWVKGQWPPDESDGKGLVRRLFQRTRNHEQ